MPKKEIRVRVGEMNPELGKGWLSSGHAIINEERRSYVEFVAPDGQLLDWQMEPEDIMKMKDDSPLPSIEE